ncbi:MAG: shikimate kinase [Acidobacteria bacterium]|nr:shikimate kinase [Acidobacteriota bacterium]
MGSGKTTVGRILAKRLHLPFKDTDEMVEESEGMSITEIFKTKGEQYFRDAEQRIILSTPNEGERVMAVGGGGFNEKTISFLKGLGPTIFLDLSFDEAKRRISTGKRRPLAEDPNLFAIFIKRKSLYSRAHYTVWTESLTVDEVVETILRLV